MMRPLLTLLVLGLTASPLSAQSLAAAAKQAADQRAAAQTATPTTPITLTNQDLKDTPAPIGVPAAVLHIPIVPSADAPPAVAYATIAKQDEAFWKARMQGLTRALDEETLYLAAMESRASALAIDLNASGSLSQRIVLRREYEAALTDATRLRAAVSATQLAITTAEEEARRANVPAGWLRP